MDYFIVDVSGTRYHLLKEVIEKFPQSLLCKAISTGYDYNGFVKRTKSSNRIFVQRSPIIFDTVILPFYINGNIHVPSWLCKESVREEFQFWQLEPNFCRSCVDQVHFDQFVPTVQQEQNIINGDVTSTELTVETDSTPKSKTIREKVWDLLNNPSSSTAALVFAVISVLFIAISILALVIGSLPNLQYCQESKSNSTNYNYTEVDYEMGLPVNNKRRTTTYRAIIAQDDNSHNFFTDCPGTKTFNIIQAVCISWFSFELIFRFLFCSSRCKFIKSPQNVVDFVSTFPFYVEILLWSINFDMTEFAKARTAFLFLRFLRIAKIFTIFKLARYFPELRLLGETLKSATRELMMLVIFVCMNLLIFSSLVYNFEKDEINTPFDSIPASFWWGIATLTTVGYGDITPQTVGGKFVGSVGCVCGVMIMALPVSILVDHFTEAYKRIVRMRKASQFISSANNFEANKTFVNSQTKTIGRSLRLIKNILICRKRNLKSFKLKTRFVSRINVHTVFSTEILLSKKVTFRSVILQSVT